MRNPRNTIVASMGSGDGAARVREMFTAIAERDFASNQSRLLADMARELVMAFKVEDVPSAERLGLFHQAVAGPHICQAVVDAYRAKAKKIRDEYLNGNEVVRYGMPAAKAK